MHELSIASQIIDIAEDKAKELGVKKISKIEIEIGTLSGVVRDNLEFAMQLATKDTCLDGAVIEMIEIQAFARCTACSTEFEMKQFYDGCPSCNTTSPDIIKGKELKIRSLFID
ncbi:MAG: hydrogenase maturation nickel metallochaperone HypA [Bacteroidota bacterium]